jgi:hypothetical protein
MRFGKLGKIGQHKLPAGLPVVAGAVPTIYANFVTDLYWCNGVVYPTFAAWLAAVGGTFTRASTAAYNAGGATRTVAANGPRFPSDVNSNRLGLRMTQIETNQVIKSNDWSTVAYSGGSPTDWVEDDPAISSWHYTQNAAGPDGTPNYAWTVTPPANSSFKDLYQQTKGGGSARTACSIKAKAGAGGGNWIALAGDGAASGAGAYFDLVNGVVGTINQSGATVTASIEPAGNGFWLCSINIEEVGGLHYFNLEFHTADNQAQNWTSTGSESWIICEAMLLAQDSPHSAVGKGWLKPDYVATTNATVTQAAEVFYVPVSGEVGPSIFYQSWTDEGESFTDDFYVADVSSIAVIEGSLNTVQTVYSYNDGHNVNLGNLDSRSLNKIAARADASTVTASLNGGAAQTTAAAARQPIRYFGPGGFYPDPSNWNLNGNVIDVAFWENTNCADGDLVTLSRVA